MKLLSFIRPDGDKTYGLVTEKGIIDLGIRLGYKYEHLKALLQDDGLSQASKFAEEAPDYAASEIQFLPVIESPNKILCVGMNYQAKRDEFAETNDAPTLFVRFADSQTGHDCRLLKPAISNEFDYEGELAIVIGKAGKHIQAEDALDYVAGYSCYMDGSVRDWQHSWFTAGKNWPETGAFGPWLVTTDEIPDPNALTIRTILNNQIVQHDHTSNMIHAVPSLIEYISTFSILSPGDVIITGSPGGVGKKRTPPLFLKEGDVIEVEIEKIGRLTNRITSETSVLV